MRVLLATDAFPPNCGGSGWSTWELAQGLRARGHDVSVVQTRAGGARRVRMREQDGLAVIEFGAPAPNLPFVRNYFKNERLTSMLAPFLAHLADEKQIDVIHAQHVLTGPASIRAGRSAGRPVVCTVRDYWPVCYWSDLIIDPESPHLCPTCSVRNMTRCVRPRARGWWPLTLPLIPYMRGNLARKRGALGEASAVIAVSRAIATDLRGRVPELGRTRLETIPNPVDLETIRVAARSASPLQRPYAVYAGKLAPNKGTRHLVDVARAAALPWPLVVIGDGPDRAALESQAAGSGLDTRFLGWRSRDDTLRWMAHASLLVFPSHGPESLSRVLLEAAALGRAIAAMDTGGTRDILEHDRTALLSTTPQSLAGDVARLVSDASLRSQLGAAARGHIEATFDAARVVERIEALYRDLVDGRHG
jgi:glycosyltransferase involved in cell wall biosynthesis